MSCKHENRGPIPPTYRADENGTVWANCRLLGDKCDDCGALLYDHFDEEDG